MNMFRAWYVPFYYYGIIPGDRHLGNYTSRPDGTVNLLDFGCIRVFPPLFVKGVIDLYFALERDDPELAVEAYRIWGFTDLSKDLLAALNLWAAFLYAPLHPEEHTAHHMRAFLRYLQEPVRSEEHTSELQSLMRISYAVFRLK